MNVGELIRILQTHPQDLRVVVDGYEDGYDDLSPGQLRLVKISLNAGAREWVGKHGDADNTFQTRLVGFEIEEALALHRTSH